MMRRIIVTLLFFAAALLALYLDARPASATLQLNCGDGVVGANGTPWVSGQLLRSNSTCYASFTGGTTDSVLVGQGTGSGYLDKVIPRCTGSNVITFDSSGNFQCVAGGGGSPGGATGTIQYNNGGVLGGVSSWIFNGATNEVGFINTLQPAADGGSRYTFIQSHVFDLTRNSATVVSYNASPSLTLSGVAPKVIGFETSGLISQMSSDTSFSQISAFASDWISRSQNNGWPPRPTIGFIDNSQMRLTTGSATMPSYYTPTSFYATPILDVLGAASLTTSTWDGLRVEPQVHTNNANGLATVPIRRGVYIADVTHTATGGSGTANFSMAYNVGIYIDPLTKGVLNHSIVSQGTSTTMIHAGTARFGDTNTPDTSGNYALEVTKPIRVTGTAQAMGLLYPEGVAALDNPYVFFIMGNTSGTVDWHVTTGLGALFYMWAPSNVNLLYDHSSLFELTGMFIQNKIATTTAMTQSAGAAIAWKPTYEAQSGAWNQGTSHLIYDTSTWSVSGTGSYNTGSIRNMIYSAPKISAGVTYGTYRALEIDKRSLTGTLTGHVGIEIQKLVATIPAGFINYSNQGNPASTKTNWAAGQSVTPDASVYYFTVSGAGTVDLNTGAAIITDGYYDGQMMTLIHNENSADILRLRDEGTVAGTNVRLANPPGSPAGQSSCGNVHAAGTGYADLKYRDTITFRWNAGQADWVEYSCSDNSTA